MLSIVKELYENINSRLSKVDPVEKPYLINIMGLPASGKSYEAAKVMKSAHNLLHISFDSIMESCSFYKQAYTQNKEQAFLRWEIPARIAGYRLLGLAVNKKVPILFEHSNSVYEHIDLYQEIIEHDYDVCIKYIPTPPTIVLPRLEKRERFFPEERIHERWKILQELLPVYRAKFGVEEVDYWRGDC